MGLPRPAQGTRLADHGVWPVRGAVLQFCAAPLVLDVEPEAQIQPPRSGDLLGDEPTDRPAVHPADQLTDQVPVGQRVLGGGCAGWPLRRGRGEVRAEQIPVGEHVGWPGQREGGQPGGVRQHVPDQYVGAGELRPVSAYRIVQTEPTPVDQQQDAQRCHRLAHRERVDQGVRRPGSGAGGIGRAAVQVDDRPATMDDGQGGAGLRATGEQLGEGVADRREAGLDDPGDGKLHRPILPYDALATVVTVQAALSVPNHRDIAVRRRASHRRVPSS